MTNRKREKVMCTHCGELVEQRFGRITIFPWGETCWYCLRCENTVFKSRQIRDTENPVITADCGCQWVDDMIHHVCDEHRKLIDPQ